MKIRSLFLLALLIGGATAQAEPPVPKAQVMLLGTFHFSNPGLDAAKTQSLDVTSAESQRYLQALAKRIATEFKPTRVMLEYAPSSQADIQRRYQDYRRGNFELPVNEIYQLGFRIADDSGLDQVTSFDHRGVE
jgi:hypothetical protein